MPKNKKSPQKNSLIRGIRSLQGISQTELAQKIAGFSQSRISRIEQSQVTVPKEDATQLARALGVTAETLFPDLEGNDG